MVSTFSGQTSVEVAQEVYEELAELISDKIVEVGVPDTSLPEFEEEVGTLLIEMLEEWFVEN